MDLVVRFVRDDGGSAIAEYSLTFALFGFAAIVGMLGFQAQASKSLVNTRARMTCNSISLKPASSASVDASGNITCN